MVSHHPHSSATTCFGHFPCQDIQLCPIFLHSLHRIPDRVKPQRIWPLSLLYACRKLLAFSSSYTNAVAWLPLHTCVWAPACKLVEGRVLDLGLLVPKVFTVYILRETPRRPPEDGFADSDSLKEGTGAQFLWIHAQTGHHQSFKFLPICWMIISLLSTFRIICTSLHLLRSGF